MTKKSDELKIKAEKDVFDIVAMLAHELKNGFTTNIGILNRILQDKEAIPKDEIARVIKKLEHLQRMTNGVVVREVILNFANAPQLDWLDYSEILKDGLEYHEDTFKSYQKRIDRSMGHIPKGVVVVKSHRAVLEMATNTILENQGPYGGQLLAYGYREEEIYFDITFYSDGPTVPAWLKDKLFKSTEREFQDVSGTGYGLFGAQRLLKKIGCLLLYEEVNGHPLFVIRIPKEI